MNNLLDNISILFKKYGVRSVTMDDIAREFGISKKTLYQHFENKTDVVYKLHTLNLKKKEKNLKNCAKNTNM